MSLTKIDIVDSNLLLKKQDIDIKSSEQELSEDLLSIVINGKRSYKARIENIKNPINNESTTANNNR